MEPTEGADQANALALIKSSASLSLGVTEHSNFGGYLHGRISGKLFFTIGTTSNSHSDISFDRLWGRHYDWNLAPILVLGL